MTAQGIARLVEAARDPALATQAQHAAFTRLIERSQHLVLALARSSLRDAAEAQDVAQESFTTAWLRLSQLRDAAAFTAWLRAIVLSQCRRRLRRRLREASRVGPAATEDDRRPFRSMVASAIATLPVGERRVVELFYHFGYTVPEIAARLGLKPGTIGKRLHSARLRIRRRLPPSVRAEFVPQVPSAIFIERLRRGVFDDYVGEYRFERRRDLVVRILRDGDSLVSVAGGQRHVLASLRDESLLTSHYDGEGRFVRNRRGKVTHFVYYEFGRRMGIARKLVERSFGPARAAVRKSHTGRHRHGYHSLARSVTRPHSTGWPRPGHAQSEAWKLF